MSTPNSPRARTPSRVGTPIPALSRLAPPQLVRPAASASSSRIHSHGTTSVLHTPVTDSQLGPPSHGSHEGAGSPASSALTIDMPATEGILVQDVDTELELIDGEQGAVTLDARAGDEESKQHLREQLRRTLNEKESSVDPSASSRRSRGKAIDMHELSHSPSEMYAPRQYFVMTDAGKPVFVSQQQAEASESFTSTIGIMQALISVFLDDGDKLRCVNAGSTRITFLLRSPLYYVCVSSWGEPESVTRFHLEYLHLQILSVVSAEQLRRMFERRTNFDLRRLLSGAEPFLYSLLTRLEWDLAMSTSSLQCLKLEPMLRKSIADVLVPTSKIKDILYVILIAQGRVITLVRPRKHSIHPSDLHILVNTVHAPSIINSPAAASWLPVCLPKFNAAAFVNAYVLFLRRNSDLQAETRAADGDPESQATMEMAEESNIADQQPEVSMRSDAIPDISLVCVSGSADLEGVRRWCETIDARLTQDGLLETLTNAILRGETEYTVGDVGVPGLRHFMYKSRSHVQVTMPLFEEPYDDRNEKRRLTTLYQTLYDSIHGKSGQGGTVKLQYLRTGRESVMGWITQSFELYLALSPHLPKTAAINAANGVARWVQKEEKRLFLRDAPVF